jgi:hypothetical protein
MGMFDKLKKKATTAVDEHGEQIAKGIDKAAAMADKRTGGKRSGQIASGAAKAKDALDKLDGRDDDIPPPSPRSQPPAR